MVFIDQIADWPQDSRAILSIARQIFAAS